MVQQITNGVKISVKPRFEGLNFQNNETIYVFSYQVTIKNISENTVQLISRKWEIFDALQTKEVIAGKGVIGEQPILKPQQEHNYNSYCTLYSTIGSMTGFYLMLNLATKKNFKVDIPTFQFITPSKLN